MKFILCIIVGIIGFILGESISAFIRNDTSGKQDDSLQTWALKIIIAFSLMALVFSNC